jgi:cell division protein FtsQ
MLSYPSLSTAEADLSAWAEVRWMNLASNLLFAAFGAAALVLLLQWCMRQPTFGFRSIVIQGEVSHNSVATLRANAIPELMGNFFTMNLRQSQQAFEAVPWVRSALVQRVWPHQLRVQLQEHRAAAIWIQSEESAPGASSSVDQLVNTYGEVFQANVGDVEDQNLITLRGPAGSAVQMLAMAQTLAPVWRSWQGVVEELSLSGRGSWRVRLDTGAVLELGRGSPLELRARCEQFVRTVGQFIERYQRPVQYADLRHRDGYALRLRGISTTLSADEIAQANKKNKP